MICVLGIIFSLLLVLDFVCFFFFFDGNFLSELNTFALNFFFGSFFEKCNWQLANVGTWEVTYVFCPALTDLFFFGSFRESLGNDLIS